jgi:hypothetical protein
LNSLVNASKGWMKPCRRNCHGNNHSHIHTLVVPERWADWHATSVHIEGHSSWHSFGYYNNGGAFGRPAARYVSVTAWYVEAGLRRNDEHILHGRQSREGCAVVWTGWRLHQRCGPGPQPKCVVLEQDPNATEALAILEAHQIAMRKRSKWTPDKEHYGSIFVQGSVEETIRERALNRSD